MTNHNDLKGINTPLLAYMINIFLAEVDKVVTFEEKTKSEKTLRSLQQEMELRTRNPELQNS
jgi:hypothetical protein